MYLMTKNILIVCLFAIFLSGCSTVSKLDVFKTEVEREPLNLSQPEAAKMENIKWVIITSENAEEVFAKLEKEGIDPVLWGLTDKDFELLAKNFARIRNQMVIQNDLIDKYKEYYEGEENAETKE